MWRAAGAEMAVDGVGALAVSSVGRGRRIHRVDLPAHSAGELVAYASRPGRLPVRLHHVLLAAGSLPQWPDSRRTTHTRGVRARDQYFGVWLVVVPVIGALTADGGR